MTKQYTSDDLDQIVRIVQEKELKKLPPKEITHTRQDIVDSMAQAGIPEETTQSAITEYDGQKELREIKANDPCFSGEKRIAQSETRSLSVKGGISLGGLILGLGLSAFNYVLEPWWNASEYALERLSAYSGHSQDPVSINERNQIISDFDEIIEEHKLDDYSDDAAARYFSMIETSGKSFGNAGKILDLVSKYSTYLTDNASSYGNDNLAFSAFGYLTFVEENNFSLEKAEVYLHLMDRKIGHQQNASTIVEYAITKAKIDLEIKANQLKWKAYDRANNPGFGNEDGGD